MPVIGKNKGGNGYLKASDGFYLSIQFPEPDTLSLREESYTFKGTNGDVTATRNLLIRSGKKESVIAIIYEKRKRSYRAF